MKTELAKQEAIRAKQDTITVTEKGKDQIAQAKADALVKKETAVVQAEQQAAVAKLDAEKAKYIAAKVTAEGRAEAEVNRLKVLAGLTPKEAAEYKMKTAIGVAEKMATVKFPNMMIIGGDSKGGQLDPFQAVGLKTFMEINKEISEGK